MGSQHTALKDWRDEVRERTVNPDRQEGIWFVYCGGDGGKANGNCGENKAFKTDRKIWKGDF